MESETPDKSLTISDICDSYPRQWVAVEITRRDEYGWPIKGIVRYHVNINEKYQLIQKIKELRRQIYTFYTGPIDDVDAII